MFKPAKFEMLAEGKLVVVCSRRKADISLPEPPFLWENVDEYMASSI